MERRRREGSHEMIPRREPRQQKSTKRTGHKVVFILGTVLLVGICTVAMLAGLFMMYVRTTLAPTLEVNADDYTMNLSSIIYYQDRDTGDWVEYQTVYGTENRIWVDYEQIPDALWQAAVAIEDHRFFEHNGVDWTRTASATLNFFTGSRATFGGSTLTQQVLKNMTGDDGNTINRKVREIFRALELEKSYTKEEILERFSRGDKARSTEGSGLGLSIAQGFTIACGGAFDIDIDGDMFKVRMTFPLAAPAEITEEKTAVTADA